MSKKKSSRRRRRKAGKKAMSRRKRRSPAKKAARRRTKKATKKASRRRTKKATKKASRRRTKKATKKAKASPKRRRRTLAGKARRAQSALKRISSSASKAARAMGMIKAPRKNPAGILGFLQAEAKDMMALAPSIAVQLGAMAAVGFAASKASEQIKKMVVGTKVGEEKAKAEAGFVHTYAGAMSSGAVTFAAFAAMKMMKSQKVRQFSLPVLMGGMAATMVQILAAVKVKPKDSAIEKSLGQHLGLPIGDYMALSGFLDVHGQRVAIDGLGDYIDQPLGALDISRDRFGEGSVVSMGEYVDAPLGALDIRQTIEGSTLGEIGQMSEGRQGARALGAEGDPTIESFVDSGSLAGSVFD